MNADERLSEAVKQARIAGRSEHVDEHCARMLENAAELLERSQRRVERRRLARKVEQEP